jgi:hypothetical protein
MAFHVFLFLLLSFLVLSLARLWHLALLPHNLPSSRAGAVHPMVHRLRHRPALHAIVRPVAFPPPSQWWWGLLLPCAPLARGQKPAGRPKTHEHPGLRLSPPSVSVFRDHRCSRSCGFLGMVSMVMLSASRPCAVRPVARRSRLGATPPCTV